MSGKQITFQGDNGEWVNYDLSDETVAFFDALTGDKSLQAEVMKLVPNAGAIVVLAQQRGFATTEPEIQNGLVAPAAQLTARAANGELTDAELDLVSGGVTYGTTGKGRCICGTRTIGCSC